MTATPAQVANDLDAQARYFGKSDVEVARLCRDTARLIRQFIRGERVDGRTYFGCTQRLRNARYPVDSQIDKSLWRGRMVLEELHRVAAS